MTRKRKRRAGSRQDQSSYVKLDAFARLVDAAVGLLRLIVSR